MEIYLDYSATTPPRPESIAAIQAALVEQWGNPSSLHGWGERSAMVLESSRMEVAAAIGAEASEIVFTASGTEADNLALLGVARQYPQPQHLIISMVEHPAVSAPAAWLATQGWQVTRLPVDSWGRVDPQDLLSALQANTVLVSIIHGQSEVGTVQPIEALAHICRQAQVLFHSDGVQTVGRLPIDVKAMGVDLFSLSSHKIYGGGGAGALYVRQGLPLAGLILGGGQEQGQRSGTPALGAIAGFGAAAALIKEELSSEISRQQCLRDQLWEGLRGLPGIQLTGHPHHRLPHHLSLITPWPGRQLVRALGAAGLGVSSGSACHSGLSAPSEILQALGYSDREANCGLRFSVGRATRAGDIERAIAAVTEILA
jgi:cysteine desulfurase